VVVVVVCVVVVVALVKVVVPEAVVVVVVIVCCSTASAIAVHWAEGEIVQPTERPDWVEETILYSVPRLGWTWSSALLAIGAYPEPTVLVLDVLFHWLPRKPRIISLALDVVMAVAGVVVPTELSVTDGVPSKGEAVLAPYTPKTSAAMLSVPELPMTIFSTKRCEEATAYHSSISKLAFPVELALLVKVRPEATTVETCRLGLSMAANKIMTSEA
jgi:hypothetical protein